MAKLAIKSDNQNQIMLFPPSLDELIPSNHVVRIVSAVIDPTYFSLSFKISNDKNSPKSKHESITP